MTSSRGTEVTLLAFALLGGLGSTALLETYGTDKTPAGAASIFLLEDAIADAHMQARAKRRALPVHDGAWRLTIRECHAAVTHDARHGNCLALGQLMDVREHVVTDYPVLACLPRTASLSLISAGMDVLFRASQLDLSDD